MRIIQLPATAATLAVLFFASSAAADDFFINGDDFDSLSTPEGFSTGDRLFVTGTFSEFEGAPALLELPQGGAEFIFDKRSLIIGDGPSALELESAAERGESGQTLVSFGGQISNAWGGGVTVKSDYTGTMSNIGVISVDHSAIRFDRGFTGSFENLGDLASGFGESVYFSDNFDGVFTNSGTITTIGDTAVSFDSGVEGDFLNSGLIKVYSDGPNLRPPEFRGEDEIRRIFARSVSIGDRFTGTFTNTGRIEGGFGINFRDGLNGEFNNSGSIQSSSGFGVGFENAFEGNFINTGTIAPLPRQQVITPPPGEGDGFFGSDDAFFFQEPDPPVDFGVYFSGTFEGTFSNSGTIGADIVGVGFNKNFNGSFQNSGEIEGERNGIFFSKGFTGDFTSTGTISNLAPPGEEPGIGIEGRIPGPAMEEDFPFFVPPSAIAFAGPFEGNFLNAGTISSDGIGVFVGEPFTGNFQNTGAIKASGKGEEFRVGVGMEQMLEGTFTNSNLILGDTHGVGFFVGFGANFQNSGRIGSLDEAAVYFDNFSGELVNTGVIDSVSGPGIAATRATGTIRNVGGRISGAGHAIKLGAGNGSVVVSGAPVFDGLIDGGEGGGDIIRFENLRGISPEKLEELEALAEADSPGETTITLIGETITWNAFEDVQVEAATIRSYEDLLSSTLFSDYGVTLDNVNGLTDELRIFLNALGELEGDALLEAAANASGQTLTAAADSHVRSQASELFSLLSSEFSESGNGGTNGGIASRGGGGLFTREIQVGVTINEPVDSAEVFVTGYVGNGSQDPDVNRAESSNDSTSIIFGRNDAVSSQWRVGLWGGYSDYDASIDRFGSEFQSEAGLIGASAQYQGDFGFSNLVIGYGFHDQTTVRRDLLGNRMDGDAVGHQGLLHGQFGRHFNFGEEGRARLSPYLGFALGRLSMGGYTENGPAASALRFDSQTTDFAQSIVGVNLSQFRETGIGWIKPKIDVAWWHEFADANSQGISLATPGLLNPFQVQGQVLNRNRAVVQVGMEMGFDQWEDVSFDASYFGTYGEDGYSSHGGALSATFEF